MLTIGSSGIKGDASSNGFDSPVGVFVTYDDTTVSRNNSTIFISDESNHRIIEAGGATGVFKRVLKGSGSEQLRYPSNIAVDSSSIYVTDCDNHKVRVVDRATGSFVKEIGNVQGVQPGQFSFPRGICFDREGRKLLVCDHFNNRIQVVDKESGLTEKVIDCGLSRPYGITSDPNSSLVYVANHSNDSSKACIEVVDSETGSSVGKIGLGGSLRCPVSVSLCGSHLFVADYLLHQVLVFHLPSGKLIHTIADGLNHPRGVFATPDGFIYIADSFNHCIRVLSLPQYAQPSTSVAGEAAVASPSSTEKASPLPSGTAMTVATVATTDSSSGTTDDNGPESPSSDPSFASSPSSSSSTSDGSDNDCDAMMARLNLRSRDMFNGVWLNKKASNEWVFRKRFVWIDVQQKKLIWSKTEGKNDPSPTSIDLLNDIAPTDGIKLTKTKFAIKNKVASAKSVEFQAPTEELAADWVAVLSAISSVPVVNTVFK